MVRLVPLLFLSGMCQGLSTHSHDPPPSESPSALRSCEVVFLSGGFPKQPFVKEHGNGYCMPQMMPWGEQRAWKMQKFQQLPHPRPVLEFSCKISPLFFIRRAQHGFRQGTSNREKSLAATTWVPNGAQVPVLSPNDHPN